MDTKGIIRSQYLASLEMLKLAIDACPESLWSSRDHKNAFWHIVYHVLFCTHLYLQDRHDSFVPWPKHREPYQYMGPAPTPPYEEPKIGEPYSKADMLEYLQICQNEVKERVPLLDLEAESGFHWLAFGKLEVQFYNIRHVQHYTDPLLIWTAK